MRDSSFSSVERRDLLQGTNRSLFGVAVRLALGASLVGTAAAAQTEQVLVEQRAQYDAVRAKTIVELQPFRNGTSAVLPNSGKSARLISLNPATNAWFLFLIGEDDEEDQKSFHIENPDPTGQGISLVADPAPALIVSGSTGVKRCELWSDEGFMLEDARATDLPYAPLCGGRLYLRNQVTGSRTNIEKTTDFLRDHVWKGEEVVRFVRDNFFKDSHVENSNELAVNGVSRSTAGPRPALLDVPREDRPVISTIHDFGLDGTGTGRMTLGEWHPVAQLSGVFVSAIQPRAISSEILHGAGTTNALDSVEARATDYMVAFDLGQFDVGFALGTDHPRVDWSPRPPSSVRVAGMRGPDGIDSSVPLVRLGMVSPAIADRTIATFTAGFKRQHGAFKYGDYPTVDSGKHYGFIEQGVIFSKLHTDLSTLFVLNDGTISMKTWTSQDNALLPRIRFARQNGVPLLETDPVSGLGVPGSRVTQWGAGNWSGSAEAKLRTLRAGACMIEQAGRRFLVYGYFSTATPSAMARTFQAYGCSYAMLLDMNALEHTYLALYVRQDGEVHVEHIVPGMALVDKKDKAGNLIPRFIGFPDNRDFFYLTRREVKP